MARKRLQLSISLLLCMGTSLFAQSHWSADSFVIDANRPYVYLKFDHYGRGVHFGNDEPDLRFWFRFVNNCRVPVLLRTFGVPDGSLPHEVGVMDLVKRDEVEGFVTERPQPPLLTPIRPGLTQFSTKPAEKRKTKPHGYWFEVGSSDSIAPGESVLFSVPVNQLSVGWHIEIPFTFDIRSGKGPRDPAIGGEPEMFLSYFAVDLPEKAQVLLDK